MAEIFIKRELLSRKIELYPSTLIPHVRSELDENYVAHRKLTGIQTSRTDFPFSRSDME